VPTAQQPHESDGTATWNQTTVVLVKLRARGVTGLGFSYADLAAAAVAKDLLEKDVAGKNAFDIPSIHSAMNRRVRNSGRPGLVSTAISAIDICLWDLKARLLNLPLIELLGSMRDEVRAYGSGGFTSYSEEQLIDQMTGWAGEGLTAVKMKIGREPDQDVARAAAVRRAVGNGVELFVDANGAYSRKQALQKAEQFAELNVSWFEEPVSSDDRHGLHLLVERAPACMRIAAGEYSYTLDDARLLAEAGAVDVMQADATRCGGVTNFVKLPASAKRFICRFPPTPRLLCMRPSAAPLCQRSMWNISSIMCGSKACSWMALCARNRECCGRIAAVLASVSSGSRRTLSLIE
jgi:L-alanine-DL-glutamate epimerase-like enolase superfamily enzyme